MTPDLFLECGVIPALGLLPSPMDSAEARAMIVAICLQESRLKHRRQIKGPARSYAQFEPSGVEGVLRHPATRDHAASLCRLLDVAPTLDGVFAAIEFNDVLCAGFSRLNLWWSPMKLPSIDHPGLGWNLYKDTWRPGKPHRASWNALFEQAWHVVVPGLPRSQRA